MHLQEAAFAPLSSVASGNEIFVAREAARLNEAAAVEPDTAAVGPGSPAAAAGVERGPAERSTLPSDTAAPCDASNGLAAAEGNDLHPSTPSPTEETTIDQDSTAVEPSSTMPREEVAEEAAEALQEPAQETTQPNSEDTRADAQIVAETSTETGTTEGGTNICEAPEVQPIDAAAALPEADKALRTPKGMLLRAANLQQEIADNDAGPSGAELAVGQAFDTAAEGIELANPAHQLNLNEGKKALTTLDLETQEVGEGVDIGAASLSATVVINEVSREKADEGAAPPPTDSTADETGLPRVGSLHNAMAEASTAALNGVLESLETRADPGNVLPEAAASSIPFPSSPENVQKVVEAAIPAADTSGPAQAAAGDSEQVSPGMELALVLQQPHPGSLSLVGFLSLPSPATLNIFAKDRRAIS